MSDLPRLSRSRQIELADTRDLHATSAIADSLGVSWLVFLFALLKDTFPSVNLFARLKTMTSLIATPIEGFVALAYWGLMLLDPSLLVPPDPEFYLPFKLDISIHGLPAIMLWVDFLCFSPPYPKSARPFALSTSAVVAYVSWMEFTASKNGRFPYPFLGKANPFRVCLFPWFLSIASRALTDDKRLLVDTMPKAQRSLFYLVQVPVVIGESLFSRC